MNYNFDKIVSRLLLTGSILSLSLGIEGIHGMDSSKVDIRGIKVNADEDSMEYYKREADKGDLSHLVNLATIYYQGKDLDRDLYAAEKYFEKAAQLGHVPSKIFLQAIQDEKKSSTVLPLNDDVFNAIIYALEGNPIAQYDLGYHYYNGKGVPRNYEIAEKWFSHVASQKPDSHSIDAKDAVNKAHLLLAKMYHQGMGVVADSKKAAQYLEMPASELYPISQSTEFYISFLKHGSRDKNLTLYANYFILFVFESNNGNVDLSIERNGFQYCEEISYFVKNFPINEIKKSNFTICEYDKNKKFTLGKLFQGMCETKLNHPFSDQADCDACLLFLLIANNFKYRDSISFLKKIRDNTTYPKLSFDVFSSLKETLAIAEGRNIQGTSIKSSDKSQKPNPNTKKVTPSSSRNGGAKKEVPVASQGKILKTDVLPIDESTNPNTILGLNYLRGDVVKQDYRMAEQLFKQAAEDGDIEAQSKLGGMYFLGLGVDKSVDAALVYLIPAADKGDATAQNMLGAIYGQGLTVTQDLNRSIKYYTLAADQGLEQAKGNLENLKISISKHYSTTGENSPKIIIRNDISEKSHKEKVTNIISTQKDNGPKEQAIPIMQSSKKTASQNEQKDATINSKRNRRMDRPISEGVSLQNITSPVSVKEEKLPEIKHPQKAVTEEKKDDAYDGIQNNSFTISDSVDRDKKEKKRGYIRIPKVVLPKAVQDYMNHRKRTEEKKEKNEKKEMNTKKSIISGADKTAEEESAWESDSCAGSEGHLSFSEADSMSENLIVKEVVGLDTDKKSVLHQVKVEYPDLYKLIINTEANIIRYINITNSKIIMSTLGCMARNDYITINKFKKTDKENKLIKRSKITATSTVDGNIVCVLHTTHGSGPYDKWYKDPNVVEHFFEFIAKSDHLIKEFLEIHFGKDCFSRDLAVPINTNNNSPSRNENKGDESKPE